MKEKKWHRVLAVFFVMVTVLSLLSGCGGKSAEKEDAETITVYLWSTSLYDKYAPYIQEQLPDINVEFVVGNNDLDFYRFLNENGVTISAFLPTARRSQSSSCIASVSYTHLVKINPGAVLILHHALRTENGSIVVRLAQSL